MSTCVHPSIFKKKIHNKYCKKNYSRHISLLPRVSLSFLFKLEETSSDTVCCLWLKLMSRDIRFYGKIKGWTIDSSEVSKSSESSL